ncbi:MAG: PQQ-binding-like beta-propeller repeat protein [Gemmataceae bacterium]|nr:PQQ-binding-like beta-propeller repeat protein [Gemmataceae bacterium]MDW8264057.1 PQQ-binding-like beta-propeller repeat protein [Gemmataceae bacterium]
MRQCRLMVLIGLGLVPLAAWSAIAIDQQQVAADVQTLKNAKLASEGRDLTAFFEQRMLTEQERTQIARLIRDLGSDSFSVRERAAAELVLLGPKVGPLLRQAIADGSDAEVAYQATQCLQKLRFPGSEVTAAAARLLAVRQPATACRLLLAYLPLAEDDNVVEAVQTACTHAALRDGKPDPALLEAISDALPLRRAVAGAALVRGCPAEHRAAARKLLNDPDFTVRLAVALALVDVKEKEGVPVLIALLADLPQSLGWQAEDVLCRLAGDQAPGVSLGPDAEARKKCSAAWAAWWKEHGDRIDWSRLDGARLLGRTLIVQLDGTGREGDVFEIGPDNKVVWKISKLQYPVDAQVLPGERVLIAEHVANQITERNLKGEVLWQRPMMQVVGCRRLPNGNTIMVARNRIQEITPQGAVVFNFVRNNHDIAAAQKLRDGGMMVVTTSGVCLRLDGNAREQKQIPIGPTQMFCQFEVLSGDRLLIPAAGLNKVVELDARGRVIWEYDTTNPTSAARLANGNTLIASMSERQVIEVDRRGKERWRYRTNGMPWRATRR